MEDEESLEAVGLVSQPSYAVHSYLAAQVHCKVCGKDHSKYYVYQCSCAPVIRNRNKAKQTSICSFPTV